METNKVTIERTLKTIEAKQYRCMLLRLQKKSKYIVVQKNDLHVSTVCVSVSLGCSANYQHAAVNSFLTEADIIKENALYNFKFVVPITHRNLYLCYKYEH